VCLGIAATTINCLGAQDLVAGKTEKGLGLRFRVMVRVRV
jgi:hypothetical protein